MALDWTIVATYITPASFSVVGDQRNFFCVDDGNRRRVICNCGVNGYKYGTIVSSEYESPITTVVLSTSTLTENLEAAAYSKSASGATHGLPNHTHTTVSGLEEGAGGPLDHTDLQNKGTKTHTQIDTHVNNLTKHRLINDAASGATNLWSAQKIGSEIDSDVSTLSGTLSAEIDSDVSTAVAALIDSSPEVLDTLNELAEAMGDDADFATTIMNLIATVSGILSAEIDSDITTFSGTIDHNTINNTHNLTTDIDHDQLTNYAVGQHRTINDSGSGATDLWSGEKITTVSGDLSNEIDNDISTHSSSGDHDSRYYTETEADVLHTTLSGNLSDEIDSDIVTFSGTIDHDTIQNTHNLTTDIDHGSIVGLGDDDHTIYSLVDGTRDFTDEVVGVTPTASGSLATKWYVDQTSAVAGIPTGTKMYFYQNTAPTGWTIDAAVADTVLAIKGGSQAYNVTGGQIVGTWTQPNHLHTTGSLSLSIAQMPAHSHTCALWGGNDGSAHFSSSYSDDVFTNNASTSSVGSGSSHNHGNTGNGATANTYRPEAAIGIIATKD